MSSTQTQTTERDRERTDPMINRITLRVPEQQLEELKQLVDDGQFLNRSEAIRAAVRDLIN